MNSACVSFSVGNRKDKDTTRNTHSHSLTNCVEFEFFGFSIILNFLSHQFNTRVIRIHVYDTRQQVI